MAGSGLTGAVRVGQLLAGSRGSQIFLKAAGGEMEVRRRSAMRDLSPKAATGPGRVKTPQRLTCKGELESVML